MVPWKFLFTKIQFFASVSQQVWFNSQHAYLKLAFRLSLLLTLTKKGFDEILSLKFNSIFFWFSLMSSSREDSFLIYHVSDCFSMEISDAITGPWLTKSSSEKCDHSLSNRLTSVNCPKYQKQIRKNEALKLKQAKLLFAFIRNEFITLFTRRTSNKTVEELCTKISVPTANCEAKSDGIKEKLFVEKQIRCFASQ